MNQIAFQDERLHRRHRLIHETVIVSNAYLFYVSFAGRVLALLVLTTRLHV